MIYIKTYETITMPKFFKIGDKVMTSNSGWVGKTKEFVENNAGEIVDEDLIYDGIKQVKDWHFQIKYNSLDDIGFDNKIWLGQTHLRKATEREIYEQELRKSQKKFNL